MEEASVDATPLAEADEQGSQPASSFNVDPAPAAQQGLAEESLGAPRQCTSNATDAKIRFGMSILVHWLQVLAGIFSVVVYVEYDQTIFLVSGLCLWCVTAIFLSWAAYNEWEELTMLKYVPTCFLKFIFLVSVYGFLQILILKHTYDAFKQRVGPRERIPSPNRSRAGTGHDEEDEEVGTHETPPETSPVGNDDDLDGMSDSYLKRPYHGKTLVGIVMGIPYALFNMFAFYLIDQSELNCPWMIMTSTARSSDRRAYVRFIVGLACAFSICSIAAGVLEMDYRVTFRVKSRRTVKSRLDNSKFNTAVHFLFRGAEVTTCMALITLWIIFGHPLIARRLGHYEAYSSALLCLPGFVLWLIYFVVLLCVRRHSWGFERARIDLFEFVAAALTALTLLFVNPAHFLGKPGFIRSARFLNKAVLLVRIVETACVVCLVLLEWEQTFPPCCGGRNRCPFPEGLGRDHDSNASNHNFELIGRNLFPTLVPCDPARVGPYLWKYHISSLSLLAVPCVIYSFMLCFVASVRQGIANDIDDAMLELQLVETSSNGAPSSRSISAGSVEPSSRLQVQEVDIYGLSSFLLRLAFLIDIKKGDRPGNPLTLKIQTKLGSGACGVVVSVVQRGGAVDSQPYAMKMQKRTVIADRETSLAAELSMHVHPFLIRFHRSFELSPTRTFVTEDGTVLGRNFFSAIVMEYIDPGPNGMYADLEAYIMHRAIAVQRDAGFGGQQSPADQFEWIDEVRVYAAQLVEVGRFLHSLGIIHRDIKPANILLKPKNRLHQPSTSGMRQRCICLTDVGHSKHITNEESLNSGCKGTPGYAAPEVYRPNELDLFPHGLPPPGHHYTAAVDVYSFGRTLAVMLHCRKHECGNPAACRDGPLPHQHLCLLQDRVNVPDQYMSRFPQEAKDIIRQTTSQCNVCINHLPCRCIESRGSFALLARHPFFLQFGFEANGEQKHFAPVGLLHRDLRHNQ